MNDVKNVHWGILASVAAGIFFVMFIVFFFIMKITNIMILILLPLMLCMFIPGFFFLYKGFPLKGNTQFTIGYLGDSHNQFNLIVGTRYNFLYNYSVN